MVVRNMSIRHNLIIINTLLIIYQIMKEMSNLHQRPTNSLIYVKRYRDQPKAILETTVAFRYGQRTDCHEI